MKTHWLYGEGPNKQIKFNIEIEKETDCSTCIHKEVCSFSKEKLCSNFVQGSSGHGGCGYCINKYTRYDKDSIPCFHCKFYQQKI